MSHRRWSLAFASWRRKMKPRRTHLPAPVAWHIRFAAIAVVAILTVVAEPAVAEPAAGLPNDTNAITELTPEQARALTERGGGYLILDGLTALSPEVATALAEFKGEELALDGVTTLSPEAAKAIAAYKGKQLNLSGVTTLSPEAATALAEFKGGLGELCLHLNSFITGRAFPYAQTGFIEATGGQGGILGICVGANGGLVAVTGHKATYGAGQQPAEKTPGHRLVWFDAEGVETRSRQLDFAATVVAAIPGAGLCVAGDGVVALLSADGSELRRRATPQMPQTDDDRAALERTVLEQHESQLAALEQQIERSRTAIAELEEREKEDAETAAGEDATGDARDVAKARRRTSRLKSIRDGVEQLEARAEAQRQEDLVKLVEHVLRKTGDVRSICATGDAVFIVAPEPSGFDFCVWRLDADLGNPVKVVSRLAGCCRQMDVQVIGDRLAISQNRKHCVELADFDGETVGTLGQRTDGKAPGGFGGCCNPMNTCAAPGGGLLTSESNGVVKRFETDGTFVEVVGKAGVAGGCKNSAIAIEPDGNRLYYLDSQCGRVIVLAREAGGGADAAAETSSRRE